MAELNWQQPVAEIRQQPIDELTFPDAFALVPWGHHIQVMSKSMSVDEAIFYIKQTIANNWSRSELEYEMKGDLSLRLSTYALEWRIILNSEC